LRTEGGGKITTKTQRHGEGWEYKRDREERTANGRERQPQAQRHGGTQIKEPQGKGTGKGNGLSTWMERMNRMGKPQICTDKQMGEGRGRGRNCGKDGSAGASLYRSLALLERRPTFY